MKKKLFSMLLCLVLLTLLALPVSAANVDFASEGNVIDLTGVLTAQEDAALEAIIDSFDDAYTCGCYALITDDYTQFGDTAPDAVINLYHNNSLGLGSGRDGILLMFDIVNREFAFFVYGDNGEYIFDAYGQEQLEQVFVDDLGDDRWYDAVEDFAVECGEYMELAAKGEPVRQSKTGAYVFAVIMGLVAGAMVCAVLMSQMKSVYEQSEAVAYVSDGGLILNQSTNQFLYKTTHTRDLNSDDDSGSSSSSFTGGGGSGRSGSF